MPAGIFISYRRQEALKEARAIFEKLSREFGAGQVFIDLEGLDYGADFVESLERQLQDCRVMLVLIGPGWTLAPDGHGGRRLDDPNDFVRIELRTALQRNIRVVPVLFDGAPMPRTADLPADLEPLARRNKIDLDFTRFDADIGRLIGSLRKLLAPELLPGPPPEPQPEEVAAPTLAPAVLPAEPAPTPPPLPTPAPATPAPAPAPRPKRAPLPASATPPASAAPPAEPSPSLLRRVLGNAWSWSAAAVTIGVSAWQFGWIHPSVTGVALPASAPTVTKSPPPTAASAVPAPLVGKAPPTLTTAEAESLRQTKADGQEIYKSLELKPKEPPAQPKPLAVGQRFRDCDDDSCPWMVVLPSGSFLMGSPESEPKRKKDEGPQHRVQVASFAIGQYEVTFRQWDACVAAGGCKTKPGDEGWGRGQRPVINVSWHDAQQYVKWLSDKTGKIYRLPSEAEWEYAARAGTSTPFAFGERITTAQANFDGDYTYNGSAMGEDRQKTLPVGSLAKNAWDLYDLHGNASEWVQDCRHDNYQGAPADGHAWISNCPSTEGLLRGGGWYLNPSFARSAYRWRIESTSRNYFTGFRLARMLP
jgi:formylglycine-generating enzyme required for sulfatase activity